MHTRRISVLDVAAAVILLLSLLFISTCFSRIEAYGADSSSYIGLAESLEETGRYEFNAIPHTKYPPGMPVVLHLSSRLFGVDGFTDYIRVIGVFAILAAAATYCYLRLHNSTYAFVITLLLISSPWFFQLSTMAVLSEMPYLFSSMTALLCAHLLDKAPPGRRWSWNLLLCAAVAASVLIRSAAVTLPAGILLFILFSFFSSKEQGKKRLLLFLPASFCGFLVFLLWNLWAKSHRTPFYEGQYMDSYFAQLFMKNPYMPDLGQASLADIFLRLGDNTGRIFADLSQLGLHYPYIASFFYSPAVILPLLFLSAGFWYEFKHRGGNVAAWYLLCYLGIFALWPFQEGPRFILPIFPLAAYFVFVGASHALRQLSSSWRMYAPYCLLGGLFFSGAGLIDYIYNMDDRGRQTLLAIAFWSVLSVFSLAGWQNFTGPAALFREKSSRITGIARGLLLTLFAVILFFGYYQQALLAAFNISPDPKLYPNYRSVMAAKWIDDSLPEEMTVMAEQYAVIHRLTGNRVTPFPVTSEAETIKKVIEDHAVGCLIVIDTKEYAYFLPTEENRLELLNQQYPGFLNLVHRGEGFRALMVVHPAGASILQEQR